MVCNVIDECRCYAYRGETKQFCGVRRGERVLLCPSDCCHGGGCPLDGSREPFRYIDRQDPPSTIFNKTNVLLTVSIMVILYILIVLLT